MLHLYIPLKTSRNLLVFCFQGYREGISSYNGSTYIIKRRRGVVVIATAQLHSTKAELKFCTGSNPARDVSEICEGEDLWQWSRLGIRLNTFRRSTIPRKQFIIIIIIGIKTMITSYCF